MTQKQLIMEYVRENGNIVPAKMYGSIFMGKMMGSELSRRCRELRDEGRLLSEPKGKFESYYLPGDSMYDPSTNPKWQAVAKRFRREVKPIPLTLESATTTEDYLQLKEKAETWLKANEFHPKYPEALKRYERICDMCELAEVMVK